MNSRPEPAADVESASPTVGSDSDTRERLVRAAVDVFLEKGYGGTRVQDIAKRAGFTSGALYVHFPSRTALLAEAILSEGRSIVADMSRRFTPGAAGDLTNIDLFAEFSARDTSPLDVLLLEALALASRSEKDQESIAAALGEFVGIIEGIVIEADRSGRLAEGVSIAAVQQLLLSAVFGGVIVRSLGLVRAPSGAIADVAGRMMSGLEPLK